MTRPDRLTGSDHAASLVVGVDVGGTKTLAMTVRVGPGPRPATEVLDRELAPSGAGTAVVLDGIDAAVHALLSRAGPDPVRSVGVGLAGFVDTGGVVRRAPNAAGLVGQDVRGRLEAALGLPVVVDNDANCTVVAAHRLLAPDARHLVAITFGTGIGGGLVVDGHLVRGGRGFAGEPGHMVVDPDGPPCPCGQRGCWERYASGAGLAWLAERAVEEGRAPGWRPSVGRVGCGARTCPPAWQRATPVPSRCSTSTRDGWHWGWPTWWRCWTRRSWCWAGASSPRATRCWPGSVPTWRSGSRPPWRTGTSG